MKSAIVDGCIEYKTYYIEYFNKLLHNVNELFVLCYGTMSVNIEGRELFSRVEEKKSHHIHQ